MTRYETNQFGYGGDLKVRRKPAVTCRLTCRSSSKFLGGQPRHRRSHPASNDADGLEFARSGSTRRVLARIRRVTADYGVLLETCKQLIHNDKRRVTADSARFAWVYACARARRFDIRNGADGITAAFG